MQHAHGRHLSRHFGELEQWRVHDTDRPEIVDKGRLRTVFTVVLVNHLPAFFTVEEVVTADTLLLAQVGKHLVEDVWRY